jgi:hypothetical protein
VPKVDRWWLEFQDSEEEKWAKLSKRDQKNQIKEEEEEEEEKKKKKPEEEQKKIEEKEKRK